MTATSASTRARGSRPAAMRVSAFRRPLSFGAIGLTVTALGYAQLAVMIDILGISGIIAYVVQAVVSIELSYLLNRFLTWRDRNGSVSFAAGWAKFHVSRLITIPLNTAAFAMLTGIGLHYMVANTACVLMVMLLNYVVADRFVFAQRTDSDVTPVGTVPRSVNARNGNWAPSVSIVVPVKNSSATIRPLVDSLLAQDYTGALELIVVGDPGDSTWGALEHEITTGRIVAIEADVDSPCRDANGKRAVGLDRAIGEVLAVTDSDMVMARDWVSTAVGMLRGGENAVAGPMIGIGEGFWADYVDHNAVASKTPRMQQGYLLTQATFGQPGFKPPVTANFFCTREVLVAAGLPDPAFARSYEDYSWFRRVVDAGYAIRCDSRLSGQHHHREGWRSLTREYRRSGWGCGDYVVTNPHCRFAQRRLVHLAGTLFGAVAVVAAGIVVPIAIAAIGTIAIASVMTLSWSRVRTPAAALFPLCTALLGIMFTAGMLNRFLRRGWSLPAAVPIRTVSSPAAPTVHTFVVDPATTPVASRATAPISELAS